MMSEKTIEELKRENQELRQNVTVALLLVECIVSIAEDYKKRSADKVLEQSERDRDLEFDVLAKEVHDFTTRMLG